MRQLIAGGGWRYATLPPTLRDADSRHGWPSDLSWTQTSPGGGEIIIDAPNPSGGLWWLDAEPIGFDRQLRLSGRRPSMSHIGTARILRRHLAW